MNAMPWSTIWFIPLLPFAGFLINGTLGRRLPRATVSTVALLFTALPAALIAWLWTTVCSVGAPDSFVSTVRPAGFDWINITGLHVDFAFAVDHLTLIMLAVVTGVGFLIHIYSVGYMGHEEGYWRFFAYLNLFMFFMSVLVLAANFLLLFVGWEGVGLCSYLLIGFYFKKTSAANAGKKAFIVNRIGDFGFLLAMFLLIAHFGSLDFKEIFATIAQNPEQIPLYIWLPDAMEGPTPVSALIHAATMVTAGVYMVARCHVLFNSSPLALTVVAVIGAATAFFAASIGMVQHDIKRVLAYSTISQLGYMFLACGVGAYAAGIFHLLTHAFFKALLFLAAGSVIHALGGEQDMRQMGGLRTRTPITFWCMSAGVFAIAGIPPFAGFFSKDEILYRTFTSTNPLHIVLWLAGLATAGMTSFYMFRLWFKTFFGEPRVEQNANVEQHSAHGIHESPWIMLLPLCVLALLSVAGGWVGIPAALGGSNEIEHFLDPVFASPKFEAGTRVITTNHGLELTLALVSVLVVAAGFYIAYVFYYRKPGAAAALAEHNKTAYNLVKNKYWVDEFYNAFLVTPLLMATRIILEFIVDGGIVDGSGAAAGASTRGLAWLARKQISGNIRSYAGWLALGAAAVIAVMVFGSSLWGAR